MVELPCGIHEHSFALEETVAPTCSAQGFDVMKCITCNAVRYMNYTEVIDHEWQATLSYNTTFHWFNCTHCDAVNQKEEHVADENNLCTVCGMPVGATEGVLYDLSSDGTYYEVIGYTGTATSIRFAESINGLPVKTIYSKAFYGNTTIKVVIIPNSVKSIGSEALDGCRALTSVVIGDSVTSIGNSAFSSCSSLKSVKIPNSVTSIGDYAFYGCRSLTSVVIGDSVTSIGNRAFTDCSSLTSVVLGDSVTSIGEGAFAGNSKLQFNEYENCKYLGSKDNPYFALIVLSNQNLSSYAIHANTKVIAGRVFYNCTRLTSVVIGDSVTSIGDQAFDGCSSLTSIVLGDSVTSIGEGAFKSCGSLTSIVIPDSVTSIGSSAFEGCSSLTSVVLGDSVTSIGDHAFQSCSSLTSVVIGDSLASIGDGAFSGCSNLTEVYYKGTADGWANISIGSSNYDLTNATRYYYSESQPTEEGNFWHYGENGNVVKW